jgi:hypothetical protein
MELVKDFKFDYVSRYNLNKINLESSVIKK